MSISENQIKIMIRRHNRGEIFITAILGAKNIPLIDGISRRGQLLYDEYNRIITFRQASEPMQVIRDITKIQEFKWLGEGGCNEVKPPNDGTGCGTGSNGNNSNSSCNCKPHKPGTCSHHHHKPVQPLAGMSAYEVAVKNGFEGNEAEWLDSLHADNSERVESIYDEMDARVSIVEKDVKDKTKLVKKELHEIKSSIETNKELGKIELDKAMAEVTSIQDNTFDSIKTILDLAKIKHPPSCGCTCLMCRPEVIQPRSSKKLNAKVSLKERLNLKK